MLGGAGLTLEDVERVADGARVGLSPGARERMEASRAVVEAAIASGRPVYGVTTGFGRLADTAIPPDRLAALQVNLLRSHCRSGSRGRSRSGARTRSPPAARACGRSSASGSSTT